MFLTIETPGISEGVDQTSCVEMELHFSDPLVFSTAPVIFSTGSTRTSKVVVLAVGLEDVFCWSGIFISSIVPVPAIVLF